MSLAVQVKYDCKELRWNRKVIMSWVLCLYIQVMGLIAAFPLTVATLNLFFLSGELLVQSVQAVFTYIIYSLSLKT